jgi:hypothetical protein
MGPFQLESCLVDLETRFVRGGPEENQLTVEEAELV